MSPVFKRGNWKAMLDAPADAKPRPFSRMRNALMDSGYDANKLELQWAGLTEGRRVGLGLVDKDKRHFTLCLEFEPGVIKEVRFERPPCGRAVVVSVGDGLPQYTVPMYLAATDFSVSFESHKLLLADDSFRAVFWRMDETLWEAGYSLEIKCREPYKPGRFKGLMTPDKMLEFLQLSATAAPTGFYLNEPVASDKDI